MCVGNRIKTYLDQNGIKQVDIAQKIGISPAKLNLALAGKRRMTFTEYAAICGVLGVDANSFIKVPQSKIAN